MWEPLFYSPAFGPKIRFAVVKRCVNSGCYRLIGDYVLIKHNKALAPIQKKFNGTSFAAMLDMATKSPGRPLNFEDGATCLVPVGYVGEVKAQPDFVEPDDSIPF